MDLKQLIKTHQQKFVLLIGYLIVAVLGFGLGQFVSHKNSRPEIRVEQVFTAPQNYTQNSSSTQSAVVDSPANAALDCTGKIKGNISSSGKIYHVPGSASYKNTNPELCFNTEAEAIAAGFRKAGR